ncbi:pyridoxamine 5'-phosphate oxidase family protein [Phenylobacterium sp.]|uniref:pyridoxamine 5'-phosphate oxidase family protein n=1 Tax=Phenylobacterium sp. TaxID=1871053 RepID=UPI0027326004|nr:pyridoxamine 5'-phosphate oxidase family protein [Phenylobacterium sp.]MDP3852450.1 pyridoxamine 5'-phosphate oxidase family protein [Phenylobacterium sp.]
MTAKDAHPPVEIDGADEHEIQRLIIEILDENRLMSIGVNRPDGWPQVTVVNYLRQGRALYFVVARDSQKFANISRDSRVSIAIGGGAGREAPVRGLSMAARVSEVLEPDRIEQLNKLIWSRPAEAAFTPHPSSANVAVLEARPQIVSVIDYATPPGRRVLVRVVDEWRVERVSP